MRCALAFKLAVLVKWKFVRTFTSGRFGFPEDEVCIALALKHCFVTQSILEEIRESSNSARLTLFAFNRLWAHDERLCRSV